MNHSRLPALLFLFLLVLGLLHWVQVYPQLPDRMASHFNGSGVPNGWQSKHNFFVFSSTVVLVCAAISFLVPRAIAVFPPELINLPNKSYWLAPERREETSHVFAAHMAWFGCALLFVLLYAISQAINFNLPHHEPFNSQGMIYVLIGFCLFAALLSVHLVRYFYAIPPSSSSPR